MKQRSNPLSASELAEWHHMVVPKSSEDRIDPGVEVEHHED